MILEILRSSALKNLVIVLSIGSQLTSHILTPVVAMMEASSTTWHREGAPLGQFVSRGIQQLNLISPLIIYSYAMQQQSNYIRRNISRFKGEIGITLNTVWMVPYSSSELDVKAAQRALDFMYGWFLHPLVYGEYPEIMQSLVGSRLPKFTEEQIEMLKGSFDFLGLNYYTGNYAADVPVRGGNISSTTDSMARLSTVDVYGVPIGYPSGSIFLVYPKGLYDLLIYTKKKYKNPTIYITETGFSDLKDGNIEHAIEDPQRINFYNRHFWVVREALK
ncbi:UNVERIFIED_CONTAM: Furcatin hydrolase [Sesamum angustifolium]|uniref:Furcatin hydrolase n=1 Tax=Sesamum angustifolium TaxID=2727405 RepID=A0AAW2IV39_9LAMI